MLRARAFLFAVLACLVLVAPVAAGKPVMEREPINDVGIFDEFLSAECGFDVFVDGIGHAIFRQFTDANGDPIRELNNFAIRVRYYSAGGSVRVVDTGADRVTFNADGSVIQVVIGNVQSIQLPGQGRVYADVGQTTFLFTFPPTGDPTVDLIKQAGQHSDFASSDVLCEALAP